MESSHACPTLTYTQYPHQGATFVTVSEPMETPPCHPDSMFTPGFTVGVCRPWVWADVYQLVSTLVGSGRVV
jgi:hypothetical protein